MRPRMGAAPRDTATVEFSERYVDQTELNYTLLAAAVADGSIPAEAGV